MDIINGSNNIISLLIGLGVLLTGGVASFLIIKSQITKVLKDELNVYKEKVQRLEDEIKKLQESMKIVSGENLALMSERDYLKNLVISALTTTETIHKNILEEALKKIDKSQIVAEVNKT